MVASSGQAALKKTQDFVSKVESILDHKLNSTLRHNHNFSINELCREPLSNKTNVSVQSNKYASNFSTSATHPHGPSISNSSLMSKREIKERMSCVHRVEKRISNF